MRYVATSILILTCMISPLGAQTLVPISTIQAGQIVDELDFKVIDQTIRGALENVDNIVGLEARVVLYANRPVRLQDFRPQAVIERNQMVRLVFQVGRMSISAEGRALDRAAVGESLRVMNIASRTTVTGWADHDGSVKVNR